MKLIDFKEEKAMIQGIHTPKALLSDMINRADDMEMAIVVYKTNDSLVVSNWSDGLSSEYIGLLEIAKYQIFEDMQE